MASLISHGIAAVGIGACFLRAGVAKRVWAAGVLCSMLPDVDVIGFGFGIHYGDFWGHRGFTHSLVFAGLVAGIVGFALLVRDAERTSRLTLWVYLFVATASHGLLDAMTDGGLGVAFFSPFDTTRYFLPWTPIRVSPIGIARFVSARGIEVLRSEIVWVWIPAALLGAGGWTVRRSMRRAQDGTDEEEKPGSRLEAGGTKIPVDRER